MNFQQHRLLMESDEITDATEFRVLVALCSFADPTEARCWAGKKKIAKAARLSTDQNGNSRAADGAINRLVRDGHISLAKTGGGAQRENCYEIHIGGKAGVEIKPETPHEMRGNEKKDETENPAFDDMNPAPNAGLAEKTPHLDTSSNPKTPHLNTSHIRTEVLIERNEELDDEDDLRRSQSSSTSSEVDSSNLEAMPDALTLSLCEACALMPDALGEKHRGQLAEVTVWLLSLYPDRESAAREVAVRFNAWDKPKPPHLPQIKSDWNRMMRICEFQKQTQNGVLNHASDSNGYPKPQNDFQRTAAQRRQLRHDLARKHASG